MTNPATIPPDTSKDFETNRRLAIDMVATLRARTIRVALLGQMTLRPGLNANKNPISAEGLQTVMAEQTAVMERVLDLLAGRDPENQFSRDILEWLADIALEDGTVTGAVRRLLSLCEDVAMHCRSHKPTEGFEDPDFSDALYKQFVYGRTEFFPIITAFCDRLWQSIEDQRRKELDMAATATNTISATLTRLERIGKHVRLVSLNAAVEASRAGDAGKGLTVIAVEFKSLAEEIQSLAASAREGLDTG